MKTQQRERGEGERQRQRELKGRWAQQVVYKIYLYSSGFVVVVVVLMPVSIRPDHT